MCVPGCQETLARRFSRRALLGGGRWGLECVANLEAVPAFGATLVVGGPKIKGATGGPSRLFALV